ncbi:MAG: PaaI family thioesterase [Betaproteobacteria bacterium]
MPRPIREQVLRAIAANREPGFHFAGNLLDLSWDKVEPQDTRLSLDVAPHLADKGRVGKASVEIANRNDVVCVGTGAFMALDPPSGVTLYPVPHRTRNSPPIAPAPDFTDEEREILRRADAALDDPQPSFIERFWRLGGNAMENGPHVGNHVGHAQGGIVLGLAASAAGRKLPAAWRLSTLAGWYLRSGEGSPLTATPSIVHEGRLTATLRTLVTDARGRTVIEAMTTHARR